MSRVDAYPLTHVRQVINPKEVYLKLMNLIIRLAENGLIHGDFNEFNLMIDDEEKITLIDFPQMISIDHPDAQFFFDRDAECIQVYFDRKYDMQFEDKPTLETDVERKAEIDKEVKQSVFMKEALGDDKIEDLEAVEVAKEQDEQVSGECVIFVNDFDLTDEDEKEQIEEEKEQIDEEIKVEQNSDQEDLNEQLEDIKNEEDLDHAESTDDIDNQCKSSIY